MGGEINANNLARREPGSPVVGGDEQSFVFVIMDRILGTRSHRDTLTGKSRSVRQRRTARDKEYDRQENRTGSNLHGATV